MLCKSGVRWGRRGLHLILGGFLLEERLVNVRDDTASSDGGLDQGVQLLVSTDGELQVPRCDPLDSEILGGVSGELEYLCGEVLEDSCRVDCGGGSDSSFGSDPHLQVSVDSSDGELESGLCCVSCVCRCV